MEASAKIVELEDVDAGFLGAILESAGLLGASVESFTSEIVGTGQMGKCIRFTLEASSDSCEIPKSLIGKFSSDDAASRMAAAQYCAYPREVIFYKELEPLLDIKVPQCFHADISDDGQVLSLIMEDMAPAQQGNQLSGCTPAIAEIAVNELVGLHAPTLNNQAVFDRSPFLSLDNDEVVMVHEQYLQCIGAFKEKYHDQLSDEQLAIFQKLADTDGSFFSIDIPFCAVIHGDYRLDNFLLLPDQEDPCLTVVDWQTYRLGNPLNDVAYVLATSLTVDERRTHEERILRSYYEGLLEKGVQNFSWDDCWFEYRKASAFGFLIIVISAVSVKQTDRGDAMFLLMADRISRHALDLKFDELI